MKLGKATGSIKEWGWPEHKWEDWAQTRTAYIFLSSDCLKSSWSIDSPIPVGLHASPVWMCEMGLTFILLFALQCTKVAGTAVASTAWEGSLKQPVKFSSELLEKSGCYIAFFSPRFCPETTMFLNTCLLFEGHCIVINPLSRLH